MRARPTYYRHRGRWLGVLAFAGALTLLAQAAFGDELVVGPDGKQVFKKTTITLYKVDCKRVHVAGGSHLPTPVIDSHSGHVFASDYAGNVSELNADYSERRVLSVGQMVQAPPLVMPGVGVVAVNTRGDGKVFLDDGKELSFISNGPCRATPILVSRKVFLTANQNGHIDFFNIENRTVTCMKHFDLREGINAAPAFFPDGSLVVNTMGGHIFNVDANTGNIIWQYPARGQVGAFMGSPVLAPDPVSPGNLDVIAGSEDGYLYIRHSNHAVDKIAAGGPIESTPLVLPNGNIFVSAGKRIILMNRQRVLAGYETKGNCYANPVYIPEKDLIVAGSMDGGVYFLRADTGVVCGIYKTKNAFQDAGCVVGDKVLIFH